MDSSVFSISNILSVVTLLLALVFGAIMKTLVSRAFKATDDKIKDLENQVSVVNKALTTINSSISTLQKNVIDTNHALDVAKNLDGFRLELVEKFLLRVDFVRELSLITNQIESIHPKIDQLDDKIEKLRNKVADLEKEIP
jgi:peptidoglycan hydrolase CwlO-like protein